MKNKITFTLQWIGGDRVYLSWTNNVTGNSGSMPSPISFKDASQYMKEHVKREFPDE